MSVSSQRISPTATQPPHARNLPSHQDTPKAGASWNASEQQVLPYNRLWIVLPGLMACVTLASADQTIVATALPTIVEDLGEGKNYSWVGSAYMLTSSAFSPLYGKLSDLIGRKPVFFSSLFLFLLGSALCGAAPNLTWLIIYRAVQGIGAGGMNQLVQITISDIVSLQDRGKYFGLLSVVWCFSSLVGPLVGGVLSDQASWRWCFWINLPTGGFAGIILFCFLNLNPHKGMSLQQHLSQFDFPGLALLMSGIVCVLIGLDSGNEIGWSSAETIALLSVGCTLFILAAMNEIFTTRSPIIPPRLFKTRTTGILLITCFLHAVTAFAGAYYLPLYYQVLGLSATGAGLRLTSFSLGTAAMATISGFAITRLGAYRGIIWASWAVMILGWGLMSTLSDHSNTAEKALYPLIVATGVGCLFPTPIVALQAAMPLKDMATSTGAYGFLRTMGGTVGISIGQAICTSVLKRKINRIPGLSGIDTSPAALAQGVRTLQRLPQPERGQIIHAFAQSISAIWVFNIPVAGVGFIMVLFIKAYSLKRTTIQSVANAKPDEDMTGSVAVDASPAAVEKSEGLQERTGEKEHAAIEVIELKIVRHTNGLEKV
ncbi:MFS amino acid permease [Lactarius quietus]|nr:MFS amino acid permease [Lactarius quietus]